MRAGTTSWITGCSLRSRAGPPLQSVRSPGRACPTIALSLFRQLFVNQSCGPSLWAAPKQAKKNDRFYKIKPAISESF